MTKNHEPHYTENVQEHLRQVQSLLDKHGLVEMLARKQELMALAESDGLPPAELTAVGMTAE